MEACGAWGGCTLPKGHNVGKVDIPSNHSAEYSLIVRVGASILIAEGGAPGSSLHSWRCSDKLRYPEGCTCVEDTVQDIVDAIEPMIRDKIITQAINGGLT